MVRDDAFTTRYELPSPDTAHVQDGNVGPRPRLISRTGEVLEVSEVSEVGGDRVFPVDLDLKVVPAG